MWTGKHTAILGSACVISLGAGFASGFALAKQKMTEEFELRLDKEITQTKAFYDNLNKVDPDEMAAQLGLELPEETVPSKPQYDTTSDEVPPEVLERIASNMAAAQAQVEAEAAPMHNAFEPDPEDELFEPKNNVPYLLSKEDFFQNEYDYEQGQLTYYAGDDTLADSRDEPIEHQFDAVGETTLDESTFGLRSGDPNVVYVCNEKMGMLFEICRSTKSFAEDVLGFQHSDTTPRKFKDSRARG